MKKYIIFCLTVLLIFSFLTVPVLAASDWNSVTVRFDNYLYAGNTVSNFSYRYSPYDSDGSYRAYQIDVDNNSMVAAARLTGTEFSLNQGDIVHFPSLPQFTGWIGGTTNKLKSYALAVAYFDDDTSSKLPFTVFMRSGWKTNISLTSDPKGNYWSFTPSEVTLTASSSHARCAVLLLMQVEFNTEATFSMNTNPEFTVSFGNPNSPSRPSYSSPDMEQVNIVDGLEKELLANTSDGRNLFSSVLGSTEGYLGNLVSSFSVVSQITNVAHEELPWINSVVNLSLTIGLCAFVLNLGVVVLTRIGSKSDSDSRSERRGSPINNFFVIVSGNRPHNRR